MRVKPMTIYAAFPSGTGEQILAIPVIRSRRRTLSIQIRPDLSVTVRAPLRISESEIRAFLKSRQSWIVRTYRKMKQNAEKAGPISELTAEELRDLTARAKREFPPRVSFYAARIGVSYGRVTIRHQKTLWGSCSAKGNLNFNCLLLLAPEEIRNYVIVHELCHRKQMNHSPAFWAEVEKILPDFRESRAWLRENGTRIMRRLPE